MILCTPSRSPPFRPFKWPSKRQALSKAVWNKGFRRPFWCAGWVRPPRWSFKACIPLLDVIVELKKNDSEINEKPIKNKTSKIMSIVKCKKSDTKPRTITEWFELSNLTFQTAYGFVGFITQPTRRIIFYAFYCLRNLYQIFIHFNINNRPSESFQTACSKNIIGIQAVRRTPKGLPAKICGSAEASATTCAPAARML